jgi:D-alanyl-D-alanine dipeptidase
MMGVAALRLALLLALTAMTPAPAPTLAPLVDAAAAIPGLRLDIRYATPRNFTGRVLYPRPRCLLRPAVVERLARAQAAAAAAGMGLKVFDCYRPLSVQRAMWTLVPDERYVADPAKGSRHNRGAAVDLTLVDAAGAELPMPTGFDDFSARAHRDYDDLPPAVLANRARLERLMSEAGFTGLPTEWWHFDADGWERYEVLDLPIP